MEDEIDLRKYIDVLIKHWKLIVIITGIAVVTAALVSFLSPTTYKATSAVLITGAHGDTFTNYQLPTSTRQALLALSESPAVVRQVREQLADKLEMNKLLPKIEVTSQGDLINFSAKSTNPQEAVAIANAWAESYKSYVNDLYSGPTLSTLNAQAEVAEKEYLERQKAVEDFIKDSRTAELREQIKNMEIIYDAKLLLEHIESGSSSAITSTANSLALIILQTRAFTDLPSGLQVPLGPVSASEAIDAVNALIHTLEARSGIKHGQSLTELQQDISTLRAELEQEQARQRELEGARDTSQAVYANIAKEIVEAKLVPLANSGVVEVSELAAMPSSPTAPHKAVNIGIALVLGAIVGIFSAFGLEYFSKPRKRPTRSKTKS